MARAHGIDISYAQEHFDYEVNPDDIQFVVIRASNGTRLKDSKFETFVKATANVPIRGAYHYFRSEESPAKSWYELKSEDHIWFPWKEQADFFLDCIGDHEFHFYALDLEVNDLQVRKKNEPPGSEVKKPDNKDGPKFSEDAQKWMEYVREKTRKPLLIYTNKGLYQKWMNKWPLWIAQWSGEGRDAAPNLSRTTAKEWKFWQYEVTNKGSKFGVSHKPGKKLDLDVFNGTVEDLRRWLSLPKPTPKESKKPEQPAKLQPKEPAPKKPRVITWLDVIVATNEVAKEHNEPASMWFDWAGVLEQSKDVSKWKDRYDGPPIEKWPISFGEDRDQIRAQILVRLGQV